MTAILERIFGHKWSTMIAVLIGALAEAAGYVMNSSLDNPKIHVIAGVIVAIGGALKDPGRTPAVETPKEVDVKTQGGFARLKTMLLIGLLSACIGLVTSTVARGDDVVPPPVSPTAVQLSPDVTLHLNLAIAGFAYDITSKSVVGQMSFGISYLLDYKKMIALGLGGSITSGPTPGATIDAVIGSPVLKIGAQETRLGLLTRYAWIGDKHDWIIGIAPQLQF